MDPITVTVAAQLSEIASRTTADAVSARVKRARADNERDRTIAQMDEIISDLQRDRSDLLRLAQSLEEQMVAQRLTVDEIGFISEQVIPILEKIGVFEDDQMLEVVKSLLSPELLTIMQTIGFNYRRALGEPLTEAVRYLVFSNLTPFESGLEPDGGSPDA